MFAGLFPRGEGGEPVPGAESSALLTPFRAYRALSLTRQVLIHVPTPGFNEDKDILDVTYPLVLGTIAARRRIHSSLLCPVEI